MDIGEAWRTSKVSYTELVYRPILKSGYTTRGLDSTKAVRQAVTGATLNKLIFALFTMAGALFPFVLYRLGQNPAFETRLASISLTMAVSLSLLLVFGYLVLYCVQVLPSFVSSGSFAPLAQLPLTSNDVARVAGMTLLRALDYILLVSVVTQIGAVAYFTGSVAGTLLVLFVSLSSSLLAVGLALWLTSLFQTRLEHSSLSGVRALFRPLYFVLWGLGVMSAVFLFSIISYVALPLEAALAAPGTPAGFLLSLILPFSVGVLVSHFQGQSVESLSLILALIGLGLAALLSMGAWSVISRVIGAVVLPAAETVSAAGRQGLSFRVRGPLSAYILKDIRVSSRNPATGFLFALPFFEIIAVVIPITATSVVRMSALIVGAQVGGGFALFVAFLLVTVEDFGVERRTALPFSESVRTLSKVVVSTAAYIPVPLALALVLVGKASTFEGGAAIPFATIASVFAAGVFEVSVLKALADAGKGTAARFFVGVGSGEFVLLLPALAYTAEYFISHSHPAALEALVAFTFLEVLGGSTLLVLKSNAGRRRINSVPPQPGTP